jgi:hypothetical protein
MVVVTRLYNSLLEKLGRRPGVNTNRVSWSNLNLKYPIGMFLTVFWIKQEDIPALLVAVEVLLDQY